MKIDRVFLVVLDSFGVGAEPDWSEYDDEPGNTLAACAATGLLEVPALRRLGLFRVPGVKGASPADGEPAAAFGRMRERSKAKDTVSGHWEIAGISAKQPFPTYPDGLPRELLDRFEAACGRGTLCGLPYSGTEVIRKYGPEHEKTGKLIVYTSGDSVFQIAAHEDTVPLGELYRCCGEARKLCTGEYNICRVIARPFRGKFPDYVRTADRRDFALAPPGPTLLDSVSGAGLDCIAVGKIRDIFSGRGVTRAVHTENNGDGMDKTIALAKENWRGLCFVNLVDFDMVYGHRNDSAGYAGALSAFDRRLPELLGAMKDTDALFLTADHGCDPSTKSTDHSREYVPLLAYGAQFRPAALGTRETFADLGQTAAELLGVRPTAEGTSFREALER